MVFISVETQARSAFRQAAATGIDAGCRECDLRQIHHKIQAASKEVDVTQSAAIVEQPQAPP